MTRTLSLLLALSFAAPALAQSPSEPVRATTEDGRRILVYGDGTWRLDRQPSPAGRAGETPPPPPVEAPPPAPPAPPPPAGASSRTLTSASGAYSVAYDPTVWSNPRSRINEDAEFELTLPFGAGYAITIYEAFPATSKQVRDVVIANAQQGIAGLVEVRSERAIRVPGGEGVQVEFEALADNGLEFVFITSAFGTSEGSLQVTTFTAKSAVERHRAEMLRFHEGVRLAKAGG